MRGAGRVAALAVLAGVAGLAAPAAADLLETRDGQVLEGVYLGGTEQVVRFKVGDEVQVLGVEEVVQVRFTVSRVWPPPASPAATPTRAAAPAPGATAPAPEAHPAPAPAAPKVVRVDAGTRLRVRMVDGIDSRTAAVGDRFTASLETGLGLDGVPILPAGTKLYGQVAELRATGPAATRLKLELTQLMLQGQLFPIVTGPHQLVQAEQPGPASAATIPVRPGVASGSVLEFRLLQPFAIRVP
jgi:hypothetical protein